MDTKNILSYVATGLSDIDFMMAMIVIVLVAACFLGRYVVISRKMLIATLGIIVLQIAALVFSDIIIKAINPEMYQMMEQLGETASEINLLDEQYESFMAFVSIFRLVLNAIIFVYAFIFYLVVYKEKKFLRAVESLICLFLYVVYVDYILEYSMVYLKGGDFDYLMVAFYSAGSWEAVKFNLTYTICSFVLTLTLLLILYFGYYKKKRVYIVRVRDRILFIVWLVIFAIVPVLPFRSEDVAKEYNMLSHIFGALLPVLGCFAPVLLVMNAAEKNLRDKNEYQETYLNAELEYIEQYKRTQTETRAFRHDIINNLSLTNMMLDEGKTEEASQHLKQLLGNVKALSPAIITGDEMLDCIVAMKADKMKELGITFTTDGVIDGGLHMKPMDVCSIFANALDNAIEASSKIEDNPWVSMNIKRTEKFFIVKISNSAEKKVDVEKLFMTSGYTSKKDTERHGFGLRNIRNSVEEYDGLIKAESNDESFGLSVMIPRHK